MSITYKGSLEGGPNGSLLVLFDLASGRIILDYSSLHLDFIIKRYREHYTTESHLIDPVVRRVNV